MKKMKQVNKEECALSVQEKFFGACRKQYWVYRKEMIEVKGDTRGYIGMI